MKMKKHNKKYNKNMDNEKKFIEEIEKFKGKTIGDLLDFLNPSKIKIALSASALTMLLASTSFAKANNISEMDIRGMIEEPIIRIEHNNEGPKKIENIDEKIVKEFEINNFDEDGNINEINSKYSLSIIPRQKNASKFKVYKVSKSEDGKILEKTEIDEKEYKDIQIATNVKKVDKYIIEVVYNIDEIEKIIQEMIDSKKIENGKDNNEIYEMVLAYDIQMKVENIISPELEKKIRNN